MGVTDSDYEQELAAFMTSLPSDLQRLRDGGQELQDTLDTASDALSDLADLRGMRSAVRIGIDGPSAQISVQIDEEKRRSLEIAEFRDAFAMAFAGAAFPVDLERVAELISGPNLPNTGDPGAIRSTASERRYVGADGQLVLVTTAGRPARLEVPDEWLMYEPSGELAAAVVELLQQAVGAENARENHDR